MRALTIVALVVVAAVAVSAVTDYEGMFNSFKAKYGRKYADRSEEARRFQAFVENMQKAEELAKTNPLATFGANEFSDMPAGEFKTRHNGQKAFAAVQGLAGPAVPPRASKTLPPSRDWRQHQPPVVTYVKNQGQCGSCWSFSTTGGIEGQWALAGNSLVALSEQELVSCDTIDHGCNGGLMDNAFNWLIQNRGGKIVTEDSYPYVSGEGSVPACSMSGTKFGAQISGHHDVAHDETTMAEYMGKNGPLSVAVDATSWQTYTGGILSNCQSTQLDHGVLIVGFEGTGSTPYWIVKNSWGGSWGEQGFIRIAFGSNQCLINNYPTSALVNGSAPVPPPGPNPPSPPGPGPQPPAPTPASNGTFTQKQCTNSACTEGCQKNTFNQGSCLQLSGGGSATATCSSTALEMKVYMFSSDCSGSAVPESNPINQCVQDEQGTYFENTCSNGNAVAASASAAKLDISSALAQKLQRLRKH